MAGFQHPTLMITWSCDRLTLAYTHPTMLIGFIMQKLWLFFVVYLPNPCKSSSGSLL